MLKRCTDMTIIDRLRRNAEKQRIYRHFVRRGYRTFAQRKRMADAFFLANYAKMKHAKVAKIVGLSRARVSQIALNGFAHAVQEGYAPRFCHPRGSCLLGSVGTYEH